MKRMSKVGVVLVLIMVTLQTMAQKIDEARMTRDIAVAENILNTLIKQEFDKRTFFPIEVKGSYQAGYGVIFNVPSEVISTMTWGIREARILDGQPGAFTFSWSPEMEILRGDFEQESREAQREIELSRSEIERAKSEIERAKSEIEQNRAELERAKKAIANAKATPQAPRSPKAPAAILGGVKTTSLDSIKMVANEKIIQAVKTFIADYGDMITQLGPDEKIVITNKGEGQFRFYGQSVKRSLLSVEALKSDLVQLKQGKLTRDQFLNKIKVTNSTSSGKAEPDLELLTSIFNRLYRSDLSTTFFVEGNAFYDRLTDFGAIIYMQVYSSNQIEEGLFSMPTVNLREVDQETRDKKVKELYPVFESELKENILEYGRTVKSLSDNEQLVFNVKLTRCVGCGIPAEIEVSIKSSVLKDYGSGKINKQSAIDKIVIRKGGVQ